MCLPQHPAVAYLCLVRPKALAMTPRLIRWLILALLITQTRMQTPGVGSGSSELYTVEITS
jgi:hypothetical protein